MSGNRAAVIIALLLPAAAALAQDRGDLDAVKREVADKWRSVESYAARVTTDMNLTVPGRELKQTGKGTLELVRHDSETYFRQDVDVERTVKAGGKERKMSGKVIALCDGEFVYQIDLVRPSHKTAEKYKVGQIPRLTGGYELFSSLETNSLLSLGPDESVDGQACWVVRAAPKGQQPGASTGMEKYYLRKDNGLLTKIESIDMAGRTVSTTRFFDFEVGKSIDPKRFKFELPEGAKLVDRTMAGSPTPTP